MKSKHDEEEPEKENGERWLLTYSDLITLLLALFIILYTMSSLDLEKLKELSKNLSAAFNNTSTSDSASAGGAGSGETAEVTTAAESGAGTDPTASAYSGDASEPSPLDEIYQELSKYVKDNNLENKIALENTETYVKISLKDVVLFVPDKSIMLENSQPILQEIQKALTGVYDKIDHITISGHTADADKDENISSDFAWQLSTARAVSVLNYLANQGLPQYKLSIEGYSHFNPIAENNTESGRSKNRRVEITVSKNKPEIAETPTVTASETAAETTAKATKSTKAE